VFLGSDAGPVDLIAQKINDRLDQRRAERFFDGCADLVAKRALALIEAEYRDVAPNERCAAILAVQDTFERANFTDERVYQADLDAQLLQRQLRPTASTILIEATLSASSEQLYWLVLRESCAYLVEVVTTLPRFESRALTTILRRETALLRTLSQVLDRLPERRGPGDFAADYRRLVVNRLDRMELFGVTLSDASRRYPLSTAYVSLSVLRRGRAAQTSTGPQNIPASGGALRVEEALADQKRVLLVGDAGSGKTTLLQWLAVRSARSDFSQPLATWNNTVPFFIPLRRYVERELPSPEQFPHTVGRHIAQEMPDTWVHDLLRAGEALVLVDGVDELPEVKRADALIWLKDIMNTFNQAYFIVASRPSAIDPGWDQSLTQLELLPMSMSGVRLFVEQWHNAMREETTDAEERERLRDYERSFIATIESDRHLRALVVNPLLCALLCALNRERVTHLPRARMEIYDAALRMLLDRRDEERGVRTVGVELNYTQKVILLQHLAFWLVRNGWADTSHSRAKDQVGRALRELHQVHQSPQPVFRQLVERSGLLREPTIGRVGFVHRTFQDYLAGKAAVDGDEIGQLIRNAHNDQWRTVIVMAAGHAQPRQLTELLQGLLGRRQLGDNENRLGLITLACLQTAPRLSSELRRQIQDLAVELIPPTSAIAAESLAAAGEWVLDLLAARPPASSNEAMWTVRTASLIASPRSKDIIASAASFDATYNELIRAWQFFEPGEYASAVLGKTRMGTDLLPVPDLDLLPAIHQLPELEGVECIIRGGSGSRRRSLEALAGHPRLERVFVKGCPAGIDLRPIAQLRNLREVRLDCLVSLPDLRALVHTRVTSLSVSCDQFGNSLQLLQEFPYLASLRLAQCSDWPNLRALPQRPSALQSLVIDGLSDLSTLHGLSRWNGIRHLALIQCSRLTNIDEISSVNTLCSIHLDGPLPRELGALAELPELIELRLEGRNYIDLTPLAGKQGLAIYVPVDMKVRGAKTLGDESHVATF
jgi:hypothetical protein